VIRDPDALPQATQSVRGLGGLTFDDSYEDCLSAAELEKKQGFSATVFVVAGMLIKINH
jgi:hypothetical protein